MRPYLLVYQLLERLTEAEDRDMAIHETCKHFKKIRAVLRAWCGTGSGREAPEVIAERSFGTPRRSHKRVCSISKSFVTRLPSILQRAPAAVLPLQCFQAADLPVGVKLQDCVLGPGSGPGPAASRRLVPY